MDQTTAQALKKALDLIKSGNLSAARKIIVEILRDDSEVEQAWYMLSFATPDKERQIYALQQALRINPDNAKASDRLAKLGGAAPSSSPVSPPPIERASEPPPFSATPEPAIQPAQATSPPPPASDSADLLSQRLFGGDSGGSSSDPAPATSSSFDVSPSYNAESETEESDTVRSRRKKKKEKKERRGRSPRRVLVIAILLVIILGGGYVGLSSLGLLGTGNTEQASAKPTETATPEPTATEAATSTATQELVAVATNTSVATSVPTSPPTATLFAPTLAADIEESMLQTQLDILEIRDIEPLGSPQVSLISQSQIRSITQNLYRNPDLTESYLAQTQVLDALGLIGPGFDYSAHVANKWSDPLGAVYIPNSEIIYFSGLGFGGAEKLIFSRAFGLALIDQQFGLDALGVYPDCYLGSFDQCQALYALIIGDAYLVGDQWLNQVATSEEQAALGSGIQPIFLVPIQSPPAFAIKDVSFGPINGQEFVSTLFSSGGWDRVNNAYFDPPTTTEQIIHPEKYASGEQGAILSDVPISSFLTGDGWQEIYYNSLGEWQTYLLLGHGYEASARVEDTIAVEAAAGWGGDLTQIYYNPGNASTALLAHWVWDTPNDAAEFGEALLTHLNARYATDDPAEIGEAACWRGFDHVACLLISNGHVIWVEAPDATTADNLLNAAIIEE